MRKTLVLTYLLWARLPVKYAEGNAQDVSIVSANDGAVGCCYLVGNNPKTTTNGSERRLSMISHSNRLINRWAWRRGYELICEGNHRNPVIIVIMKNAIARFTDGRLQRVILPRKNRFDGDIAEEMASLFALNGHLERIRNESMNSTHKIQFTPRQVIEPLQSRLETELQVRPQRTATEHRSSVCSGCDSQKFKDAARWN